MAGAVNVSIVSLLGLILNVSGRDRDTTLSLLRSLIDLIESLERVARNSLGKAFVIAAVRVVLPWSTCPMVPMFTCGLVLSKCCFAISEILLKCAGKPAFSTQV